MAKHWNLHGRRSRPAIGRVAPVGEFSKVVVLTAACWALVLSGTPVHAQDDGGPSTTVEAPEDPLTAETGREDDAADVSVPAKETYGSQGEFQPAQVLWSSVRAAEAKEQELKEKSESMVAGVRVLRQRRKALQGDRRRLATDTQVALDDTIAATDRLKARSIAAFLEVDSADATAAPGIADVLLGTDRTTVDRRRQEMARAALAVDQDQLDRLGTLRSRLGTQAEAVLSRIATVGRVLDDAETEAAETIAEMEQARIELEAFKAGSEIYVHGVVFPIAGEYGRPIDSFGFPRMPGTSDAHWHEGIDLFARRGTPLVATERGVLSRVGIGRLGGLKLWLTGESGTEWYYAHLDSFAPGMVDGALVEAGDLVGYVGNTGNARTTPPHLHMEMHPSGIRAVNPYPLLAVVSAMDQKRIEEGVAPARQYVPVVVDRPEAETTTTSNEVAENKVAEPADPAEPEVPSSPANPSTVSTSPESTIEPEPTTEPEPTAEPEPTTEPPSPESGTEPTTEPTNPDSTTTTVPTSETSGSDQAEGSG